MLKLIGLLLVISNVILAVWFEMFRGDTVSAIYCLCWAILINMDVKA